MDAVSIFGKFDGWPVAAARDVGIYDYINHIFYQDNFQLI